MMNRTRKSFKNILFDLIGKFIIIALGIVTPKIIITSYGSEYNGLLSTISNVYIYIGLLESGIAVCAIKALYKPVNEKDDIRISSILKSTEMSYKRTGFLSILLISCCAFLFPLFVKSEIDYWIIFYLFIISGVSTVMDYFFSSKNRVLLQAEGNNYTLSIADTVAKLSSGVLKIVLILAGVNVLIVITLCSIATLSKIILVNLLFFRKHKSIDRNVEADSECMKDRKYSFMHNAVYVISCNIDVIIIATFMGLKHVSVYMLYKMIYEAVKMIPSVLQNGTNNLFGQLFHEDIEAFKVKYHSFEVTYSLLAFSLFTCAAFLTEPFLKIYTRGINDIEYIIIGLPIIFMIVELIEQVRGLSTKVIYFKGDFKQTYLVLIIEITLNIVLSIIFVNYLGLCGVLLATIFSSIFRFVFYDIYVSKKILQRDIVKSARFIFVNAMTFIILYFLWSRLIDVSCNDYFQFVLYGSILVIVVTLTYFLSNMIFCRKDLKNGFDLIKGLVRRRK